MSGHSARYIGSTSLGQSAWLYDGSSTIQIGLTDSEHTRNDGYKYSFIQLRNEVGQVSGSSYRFTGNMGLNRSAWLYDGSSTIPIGLTDAEHTSSDGSKYSSAQQLNGAGHVRGYSSRYSGSTSLGQNAWLYDGSSTIQIGFTDIEHARNDGYRFSESQQLNGAGQVRGYSSRYSGSTSLGRSEWLHNGGSTIQIGFTDTEHTRNDGYRYSFSRHLNSAGQVLGYSNRYSGSTSLGQSAWLYDGSSTIQIGLSDAEHTRSDGYTWNNSEQLNEVGQVSGYSHRYSDNTLLGRSAWLYDGSSNIQIGFTGAAHTRNDGYEFSSALQLNGAGQVSGYSNRYSGSTSLGQSAWLYDGSSTIEIGLTDAEYTRGDGLKYSSAQQLNEEGQVLGYSRRYIGLSERGQRSWFYDGNGTIPIGLTDAQHTRNDNHKFSEAQQMNSAGQVRGYSERYSSQQTGRTAWLYDAGLAQTIPLVLSTRSSDGYAYSDAQYLGEDGLVLGNYTLFGPLNNSLGSRAFYFTVADGLHDLGPLVEGGLAANGWDHLATVLRANGLGQILGHGMLTTQSSGQMPYVLTPVAASAVSGDYNSNGTVDAADY